MNDRGVRAQSLLRDRLVVQAIAARASKGSGEFQYSRFFAVGLFRLLEVAKASDPAVLQQVSPMNERTLCLRTHWTYTHWRCTLVTVHCSLWCSSPLLELGLGLRLCYNGAGKQIR